MDDKQNVIKKENYIFGLDIGSSKVNLFLGIANEGAVRVVECGDLPLSNAEEYDKVVETLQEAVHQVERAAGVDVRDVYVGIAGTHVQSIGCKGMITLPNGEVREEDVQNVIKQASTLPPQAGEIIHIFPGEYSLDDQSGLKTPKGMNGYRLGVDVQVVTSRQNALQNIAKCVARANLTIANFVLEPLASACAVLTDDERELGVCIIDVGAGSADVAVFVGSSVRYTVSLDLAGNSITSDISKCLKAPISLSKAEEIKKKYGTCEINNLIEDETFPVPGVGGRGEISCSRKFLAQVITARVQEIFSLINRDLCTKGVDSLINGGIVLTGGTCALEGIDKVAEKVFGKPARIGLPKGMTGFQELYQKPSYATGIGLLYYGAKERKENKRHETGTQLAVSVKKKFQKVRDFFKTYF